jgi:type IV secretory pathway VirB10-like protein
MTDTGPDPEAPQVVDRRSKVPGLLPRNAQSWVLCGLALLMVAVIMLSGRNAPPEHKTNAPRPPNITETNQARIQEYRLQIDEQARRLVAEQAQLQKTKEALGNSAAGLAPAQAAPPASVARMYAPYTTPEPSADLESPETRNRRERKGLFASNIALSFRKDPPTASPSPLLAAPSFPFIAAPAATALPPTTDFSAGARAQTDANERSATGREQGRSADAEGGEGVRAIRRTPDPILTLAEGQSYRLFEGTVIETVLTNRLDGTFSGPVNCMVTTNVYSHDRQHLLIPQGTRVLGEVRKLASFGEQRLAVFFHRLIMPDGFSVSLDQFQGLSQVGETGLTDLINHHYLEIFGVSLAIGAVAGLSQANTQYGLDTSAADAYRQGMATSLSQSSLRILDRYLNVLPTVTIREGHRVKVYLSNDLALPAYDKHELPSDL